jgi:hypothetical protein
MSEYGLVRFESGPSQSRPRRLATRTRLARILPAFTFYRYDASAVLLGSQSHGGVELGATGDEFVSRSQLRSSMPMARSSHGCAAIGTRFNSLGDCFIPDLTWCFVLGDGPLVRRRRLHRCTQQDWEESRAFLRSNESRSSGRRGGGSGGGSGARIAALEPPSRCALRRTRGEPT